MLDVAHPFKVNLDEDAQKILSEVANAQKVKQGNFRIGVGNVAQQLLEALADRPDLIQMLLEQGGGFETSEAVAVPTVRKKRPGEKRRAA